MYVEKEACKAFYWYCSERMSGNEETQMDSWYHKISTGMRSWKKNNTKDATGVPCIVWYRVSQFLLSPPSLFATSSELAPNLLCSMLVGDILVDCLLLKLQACIALSCQLTSFITAYMVAEQKWDIWSATEQVFVVRVPFPCNRTNLVLLDNKTRYWDCINPQIMHFLP